MGKIRMHDVYVEGETFRNITHYRIKRKTLKGLIKFTAVATSTLVIGGAVAHAVKPKEQAPTITTQTEVENEENTVISLDAKELDALHVVLMNGGLEDAVYQDVMLNLEKKGISFEAFQEGAPITNENTVIRLVGDKNDGRTVAFYGPLAREGGNHDNLMIAFEEACEKTDYSQEPAQFGKNDQGTLLPTTLEEKTNGQGTLLTIELKDLNGAEISDLLVAGLGNYYVRKTNTPNQKYFHIAKTGDTINALAVNYGFPSGEVLAYKNGLDSPSSLPLGKALLIKEPKPIEVNVNTAPAIGITRTP